MATAKKKAESNAINIAPMNIQTAVIRIVGDSPLIVHKWSEKAKKEILESQQAKGKGAIKKAAKESRDPFNDFFNTMYFLDPTPEATEEGLNEYCANGGRFGFPANAIKKAAVSGAYRAGLSKDKTSVYGKFHVVGEFAEIHANGVAVPNMREDMVKIGMGTADLRYRAEFTDWWTDIVVKYDANAISVDQLCTILDYGGFYCGLGEWRIEKGGMNGAFHVARDGE